jgi:DNA-directed RNA polymerase specialized sigma subunit
MTKNQYHNIKDMKTFNVIEYLMKEPFDMDEFLVMMGRAELLSREEEKALVIKAHQGDDEAMNQLLWANACFVTSLVRQYKGKGTSVQELLKVGMAVLKNAVVEYDVHSKESLIRFAVPQMREVLEKL